MKLSFFALLLLAILSLFTGSVSLSPTEVWHTLFGEGTDVARFIVIDSRLPQLFTAAFSGCLGRERSCDAVALCQPFSRPLVAWRK